MIGRALWLALFAASVASAQSPQLSAAIAAGQVGERYDGYMGIAGAAPPQVQRQVRAINIRRRSLYAELAGRRNVMSSVVGLTTGCTLLAQIPPGEAYMLKDGAWRRRAAGEAPPVPDYCR